MAAGLPSVVIEEEEGGGGGKGRGRSGGERQVFITGDSELAQLVLR